jgi:cation:H+ antiporter
LRPGETERRIIGQHPAVLIDIVVFAVGVAILVVGAELLVKGAAGIAGRTGLSPVVIGLTVVAFGTSTPELAVSVQAALRGEADLAVGNVVGSNIANVLLVLGLSAIVAVGGLVVAQRIVRIDVPVMIVVSALTAVLAWNGTLGRIEGALLVAGLLGYVIWMVRAARNEAAEIVAEYDEAIGTAERPMWQLVGLVVAGLGALVGGSRLLVTSASSIAESFGVSELVIGLTIVAVGTSAPEIATSVLAAIRGERDIAVGNVVGSNIFNLLGVLGLSSAVASGGVAVSDAARTFDLPVMTAVAVACLPIFFNGFVVKRWEGIVFLAVYVVYVAYLVIDGTDHGAANELRAGLLFSAPILLLTVAVVAWRNRPLPAT